MTSELLTNKILNAKTKSGVKGRDVSFSWDSPDTSQSSSGDFEKLLGSPSLSPVVSTQFHVYSHRRNLLQKPNSHPKG